MRICHASRTTAAGLPSRVAAAIFIVATMQSAACATMAGHAKTIERDYCGGFEDNLSVVSSQRLQRLRERGEPARKTLLLMAGSPRLQSRLCAVDYLCRLKDPRVLPIVRQIIQGASMTPAPTSSIDLLILNQ